MSVKAGTPLGGGGGFSPFFQVGQAASGFNLLYSPYDLCAGYAATAFAVDVLRIVPFAVQVRQRAVIDRIVINQTAAGGAGAVARIGIYRADPRSLLPTNLLFGSTSIAMDGANGLKPAATALSVAPGDILWLAHLAGVAAATITSGGAALPATHSVWGFDGVGLANLTLGTLAFPFAALPTPFGAVLPAAAAWPWIGVHYA